MLKGFILSNLPDIYWYCTFSLSYSEIPTFKSLNNYAIIYITCLYFQILIPLRIDFLHLSFLPTVICFLLFLDFGLWAHGIFCMAVKYKLEGVCFSANTFQMFQNKNHFNFWARDFLNQKDSTYTFGPKPVWKLIWNCSPSQTHISRVDPEE